MTMKLATCRNYSAIVFVKVLAELEELGFKIDREAMDKPEMRKVVMSIEELVKELPEPEAVS